MRKIYFITICLNIMLALNANAQEKETVTLDSLKKSVDHMKHELDILKRIKVSGWVQAQFQVAETKGSAGYDGGNFAANQFNRFMIRRGRVKFTYTQKLMQYVFQLNGSERGVNLVEIFGKVTDPWTKSISLTAGVMNRPFGFEIQQSSADRETPERSRYVQMLLPNERDLGAMISYQPIKGSKLYGLKVDGGFYSGNGLAVPGTTSIGVAGLIDTDTYKDFMGRIHYKRGFKDEKYSIGIGASTYQGGIANQSEIVYKKLDTDVNGNRFWSQENNTSGTILTGKKAPRIYYAGDFQFTMKSKIGSTTIRGEYITGTQSGSLDKTNSPNVTTVNTVNTVSRQFNGGCAYLIQRIGKSKHELVAKYEWYDPNTKLSNKDFGVGSTFKSAELKYQMLGLGYVHYWDENVKFMVYYNLVQNEKGEGIAGYTKDLKDNVLTFRVQYRF